MATQKQMKGIGMFEVWEKYWDKAGYEYVCISVNNGDDEQPITLLDSDGNEETYTVDGRYWRDGTQTSRNIEFPNSKPPSLPDSGDRTNFDTGAVRDATQKQMKGISMFEVGKTYWDKAGREYVCISVNNGDDEQPITLRGSDGNEESYGVDGSYWYGHQQTSRNIEFLSSKRNIEFPNSKPQALPDSGDRTNFDTGAVRDAMSGKGLPSFIPPEAIRRCAQRFEDGAAKYGLHNWMKGIPLSRYQDAITRHTLAAAEGQTDEDHLGAVLWNAAAWVWTQDEIEAGRLPASLDDRPYVRKAVVNAEE